MLVDDLFSPDPEERKAAFGQAMQLLAENKWDHDIGHGCNLFHFIAFAPKSALEAVIPKWEERLQNGIDAFGVSFDKANDAI